ncbi:uncharacterized [Tachysurus ichikawai]
MSLSPGLSVISREAKKWRFRRNREGRTERQPSEGQNRAASWSWYEAMSQAYELELSGEFSNMSMMEIS